MIGHYGGDLAGPVFRRVAESSLRYLGVTPNGVSKQLATVTRDGDLADTALNAHKPPQNDTPMPASTQAQGGPTVAIPDVTGLGARDAVKAMLGAGLIPQVDGSGRAARSVACGGHRGAQGEQRPGHLRVGVMTAAVDGIRPQHGLRLDELLRELPEGSRLVGDGSVRVFGVRHDSRRVRAGDLFVVRKGAQTDGARFVADAKQRGAVAVLAPEGEAETVDLPKIAVRDPIVGLALAAAAVYGHPSFGLEVVGITGTNGKTTTTHLVRAAIDARARAAALRPHRHARVPLRRAAREDGVAHDARGRRPAALHAGDASARRHARGDGGLVDRALARARATRVRFTVAAFTNLTQDHLDFHGTMEAYGEAKATLFLEHAPGTSVVCVDDEFGRSLASRVAGRRCASARTWAPRPTSRRRGSRSRRAGSSARCARPAGPLELRSPLVGAHNVENLVVALGVRARARARSRALPRGLSKAMRGAPGRLERCDGPERRRQRARRLRAHAGRARARARRRARRDEGPRRVRLRLRRRSRRAEARPDGRRRSPSAPTSPSSPTTTRAPRSRPPSRRPSSRPPCAPRGSPRSRPRARHGARLRRRARPRARHRRSPWPPRAPGDVVLLAGKGHEDYQIVGTREASLRRSRSRRAACSSLRRAGGVLMATPIPTNRARSPRATRPPRRGGHEIVRDGEGRVARGDRVTDTRAIARRNGLRRAARRDVTTATRSSAKAAEAARRSSSSRSGSGSPGTARGRRRVADTLAAWGDLARAHLRAWRRRRAAPEPRDRRHHRQRGQDHHEAALRRAARRGGPTWATPGNLNNLVGLPAVVFALEPRASLRACSRRA